MNLIILLIQQMYCFMFGVVSSNSFPQPLSKDEERNCLLQMSCNDKKARDKLIEHNLRLVAHIAKKFDSKNDYEDLISIGTIGLIKGVDSFKMDKGLQLTTYVSKCIENEILMSFRKVKKANVVMSLDDPIGYDKDGNEINLIEVIKDEKNIDVIQQLFLQENLNKLNKYIDQLNDVEKDIITKRYGLNNTDALSQKVIAQQYDISRSYVSRIEKRAFIKLIKMFNDKNS